MPLPGKQSAASGEKVKRLRSAMVVWKVQQREPRRAMVRRTALTKADSASPLPGKAGRQAANQARAGSLAGEWHGMADLSSPRLPFSPPHCSCLE